MGTFVLAGAIALWASLGQTNQGNVASSDLAPPAGIAQQPKAAAKPSAPAQTKDKRVKAKPGASAPAPPESAPPATSTTPPTHHEPPAAQPAPAPEPAPLPALTGANPAGKKGRAITAFWMTAPVE